MGAWTNHKTHREARAFAKSVQRGRTYYSIERCRIPAGPSQLLREWVFEGRSWVTGFPMCGHLDAEGVWLGFGPIFDKRPANLMTHKEWRDHEVAGPIPTKSVKAPQRDSRKAARR